MTNDPSGNTIVTGYFANTVSFSGTLLTTTSVSDVFIVKYNDTGAVVWARQCGGPAADRGLSVRTDAGGNIYVTGYYSVSGVFGSTTLTAAAGSQDIFVTKLDAAGNFIWARSMGGSANDYGNGITVDNSGNVVVTGQFKETADFGSGFTFTSTNHPTTGLPTYDIFVAKLDATGNTVWATPGSAPYDDRGMDIDCDPAGNIYVTGQFSDTLTIGSVVHNNNAMNAVFVLKFDPAGNEAAFSRLSSGMTMAYSMDVDNSGNINICGDYQGTLVIGGATPVTVPGPALKNIFIIRFNPALSVIWASHAGSASEVTARSIVTDNAGNVFISGMFRCRLDDYGAPYGAGMFYSIGYRDIFAAKYNNTGNFTWAKNCGGPKEDHCSGIALSPTGLPVLAGSMNEEFYHVAYIPFGSYDPYCPSAGQGYLHVRGPAMLRDVFVGSFMELTDTIVDTYYRYDCNTDLLLPMVSELGSDSIASCSNTASLVANTHSYIVTGLGPMSSFSYTWQDGNTSSSIGVSATGWYSVTVERLDHCYANTDSVYVFIAPLPPVPELTDSYGVNIHEDFYCIPLYSCPDTITVWANNTLPVITGINSGWKELFGSDFHLVNDSTIQVYNSGIYDFYNQNEYGCVRSMGIEIRFDSMALTDTLQPFLLFNNSHEDTIHICKNESVIISLNDTSYFEGSNMADKTAEWYVNIDPPLPPNYSTFISHQIYYAPDTVSGWADVYVHLINECAEEITDYWVHDSVYIFIHPIPPLNYTLVIDNYICPYDTITHIFYTDAQYSLSFTGPYLSIDDSSFQTFGTGQVTIFMDITDSVAGCSNGGIEIFNIDPYPGPVATMLPAEGVICPGDSVLLEVTEGVIYSWAGPFGSGTNTQSIYVDEPGFYYCVVTDSNGCTLSSNTVEVIEYSTPFMEIDPGMYFCEGTTVTLAVTASPGAAYVWQAPLFGTDPTQEVGESGTYYCEVTSCGILTIAQATVIQIEVPVEITASDTLICHGDTVKLSANQGMAEYLWSDGSADTVLLVSTPGTYTLTVLNEGCYNSASVNIELIPGPVPLVTDDYICPGSVATLFATGAPTFYWYDSTGTFLITGTSYTTSPLWYSATYYVQGVTSGGCAGDTVPVLAIISLSGSLPGDTAICPGATIIFDLPEQNTYLWSNGSTSAYTEITQVGSIWVEITDTVGCKITDTLHIELADCEAVFPNIFTPNGDGLNDYFAIISEGVKNLEMKIFNRLGTEIFATSDPDGKWNGTNDQGKEASTGVYFYTARVENELGKVTFMHGHVQLNR